MYGILAEASLSQRGAFRAGRGARGEAKLVINREVRMQKSGLLPEGGWAHARESPGGGMPRAAIPADRWRPSPRLRFPISTIDKFLLGLETETLHITGVSCRTVTKAWIAAGNHFPDAPLPKPAVETHSTA
jgi:hypothetical protein